jgi:hypothetical protein
MEAALLSMQIVSFSCVKLKIIRVFKKREGARKPPRPIVVKQKVNEPYF